MNDEIYFTIIDKNRTICNYFIKCVSNIHNIYNYNYVLTTEKMIAIFHDTYNYYDVDCDTEIFLCRVEPKNDDIIMPSRNTDGVIMFTKEILIKDTFSLAEISTYNKFGLTFPSLISCVRRKYNILFKHLVDDGANLSNQIVYIMCICIEQNNFEIVKYLMENELVTVEQKKVVLWHSSMIGKIEFVKYFVENGANVNANRNGALYHSAIHDYVDIVKYLVENGANIHEDEYNILITCCTNGHLRTIKYLVTCGINILEYINFYLYLSAINGHLEVIKYLVELGCNIHLIDGLLSSCCQYGYIDIIKYLVENGIDIHFQNESALFKAGFNDQMDMVRYLIDNGADVHVNNNEFFYNMVISGKYELIKFLLENYDDFDKLQGVVVRSTDTIMKELLDKYQIKYTCEDEIKIDSLIN